MMDTEQAIIDTERKAGPNIRTLKARCQPLAQAHTDSTQHFCSTDGLDTAAGRRLSVQPGWCDASETSSVRRG